MDLAELGGLSAQTRFELHLPNRDPAPETGSAGLVLAARLLRLSATHIVRAPRVLPFYLCPMGWATGYIEGLKQGDTVQFRPRGQSMKGKVESGDLCTVEPIGERVLAVGDIVLCKVGGNQYLHLIKAMRGKQFQIGNNRGGINGWISAGAIYGILVRTER